MLNKNFFSNKMQAPYWHQASLISPVVLICVYLSVIGNIIKNDTPEP